MKGKKTDLEFVGQFIEQCIKRQQLTSEEIVNAASQEIEQINLKIQETELLKKRRGKLLDVVLTFQKQPISSKKEEAEILSLFDISYPHICKFICDQLKTSTCTREQLVFEQIASQDINFCIKQLLKYKVITKIGNLFFRGSMFEKYLKSVFQDI